MRTSIGVMIKELQYYSPITIYSHEVLRLSERCLKQEIEKRKRDLEEARKIIELTNRATDNTIFKT